ncbi:unnamed protein product, partial [marine sediment metagenome]
LIFEKRYSSGEKFHMREPLPEVTARVIFLNIFLFLKNMMNDETIAYDFTID